MEKAEERIRFQHELDYISVINAIGTALSKNHKYYNAFEHKDKKTQVTEDEREEMKKFFENW